VNRLYWQDTVRHSQIGSGRPNLGAAHDRDTA